MARPGKYNKKIVNKICSLIEKDSYTVSELCTMVGITDSTYFDWQARKPEFSDSIKKARERYDQFIVSEAKKSLNKLVQGYEVEEKHVVYVDSKDKDGKSVPKIKEQKIVKKHFQPNVAATIFLLTNKASDEYKNRQTNEVTGKDGKPLMPDINLSNLDNDELKAYYNLVRKAKGNGSDV